MTKICSKCKKNLPLKCFNKNKAKKDGYNTFCRDCCKEYYKEYYYSSNKEKDRLASRRKIDLKNAQLFVRQIKESSPCTDCGEKYPYYVMDFDHLDPNTKEIDISKLIVKSRSINKLKIEISKCELVCANCHRIRTYQRSLDTGTTTC